MTATLGQCPLPRVGDTVHLLTTNSQTRQYAPDSFRNLCVEATVLGIDDQERVDVLLANNGGRRTVRHGPRGAVQAKANVASFIKADFSWHTLEEHRKFSGGFHTMAQGDGYERFPEVL